MDPDADAEWNELMEYDWSGGDDVAAHSSTADEHILDANFEEDDEPVILTPQPAPPPTAASGSSPQRSPEKVNTTENTEPVTSESHDETYYPSLEGRNPILLSSRTLLHTADTE